MLRVPTDWGESVGKGGGGEGEVLKEGHLPLKKASDGRGVCVCVLDR